MDPRIDDMIVAPSTYADPDLTDDLFERLRRESPVRWTEPEGYHSFWTITKAADIRQIERLREVFINEPRFVIQSIEVETMSREFSGGGSRPFRTLPSMDGEEHLSHRAIAQTWFTKANVARLTEDTQRIAAEFVTGLLESGGEADYCATVGLGFPLRVIMSIFGIPQEDEAQLLQYSKLFATPSDPEVGGGRPAAEVTMEGVKGFATYFKSLIADRRAHPRDDLATVIAQGMVAGAPISDEAAVAYCVILATAGFDTTSFSSAGGLLALIRNSEQQSALRADRSLMPQAIEEILRWVTPVKSFMRTATLDYQLRDCMIREGDSVLLSYASANRDEEAFENPRTFDISRQPNSHLSFGFGAHTCLGMHLARLELGCILGELLDRLDNLRLAGEPEYFHANVVHGLKRLPLAFTASQTV